MLILPSGVCSGSRQHNKPSLSIADEFLVVFGWRPLTCVTFLLLHLCSESPVVRSHGDGKYFTHFWVGRCFWLRIPAENRFLYSTEPWHWPCNTIKSPSSLLTCSGWRLIFYLFCISFVTFICFVSILSILNRLDYHLGGSGGKDDYGSVWHCRLLFFP